MPHAVPLIAILAAGFGLALVFGVLASRLKLPPLVGYLLAGILIGPATPGFVADVELAKQLAEIGVMLLMFGVGMHFSIDDLLQVRRIALPGAIAQIAAATALGTGVALLWGWPIGHGIVLGIALSVASTVVLLRALEERNAIDTTNGRIAVGWLVVEDLAMILALVLLPPLAATLGGSSGGAGGLADLRALAVNLGWTLGKVALFVAVMLIVGRRVLPWLLSQVAQTGSRELFTLSVVAGAVGIAYGSSELFGVSFALGAFFAGVVIAESDLSHRAATESLPLREAFAVLFFVAVGMLFDPMILVEEPWKVLAVLSIILVGKSLAAFAIVVGFGYPLNTALIVSASLAQIGEFSFILAALGIHLGLFTVEGQNLILAGALLSIALNPFLFRLIGPAESLIRSYSRLGQAFRRGGDHLAGLPTTVDEKRLTGHVVLVGYGRVGQRICDALIAEDIPVVIAEENREVVETLRRRGLAAVSGNGSEASVLIQAHIARARMLVAATPDPFKTRQMVDIARKLNPNIETVARSHTDEETDFLNRDRIDRVFMGENELALSMTRHILERRQAGETWALGRPAAAE
ncbi:MAG: YbaL family putative K(+) efflux transporter [Pseudomonadota bacterium]